MTEKQLEARRQNIKKAIAASKISPKAIENRKINFAKGRSKGQATFRNSEIQRRRRIDQITKEENMANDLKKKGYEVFSPTVVCDRIVIKDNKVYFVEFKKLNQTLRSGQQKVHDLMPDNYLIIYDAGK